MTEISEDHIRQIAEEAASLTVSKVFRMLGVNADDTEAVIAVQKDFAHLRAWRESMDTIKKRGLGAAVAFVVTGVLGLLVITFTRHS